MSIPTIIHVPHASTIVPREERARLLLNEGDLDAEILRMTDAYTDEIFPGPSQGFEQLRFPVSRLILDPERFENDEDEPMSRVGMGVIYTMTSLKTPLAQAPDADDRDRLLNTYYRPHHARLERLVSDALAEYGTCLVVDGHSFPARPLPYEPDQRLERPDICIGTDTFHTPDHLLNVALEMVRDAGFSVDVNRPFAGVLVPSLHYGVDARVNALMIEVNRSLYMDEATGEKTSIFENTRRFVHSLVNALSSSVF
jgi:N-formylglutamate deformylase